MLAIATEKKKKYDSVNAMQDIRKERKLNSLTKYYKINKEININEWRGKPGLSSDITMIKLEKKM